MCVYIYTIQVAFEGHLALAKQNRTSMYQPQALKYPYLDTVIVNAGVQSILMFKDTETGASKTINEEVTMNFTTPVVFCQALTPFFLKPIDLAVSS